MSGFFRSPSAGRPRLPGPLQFAASRAARFAAGGLRRGFPTFGGERVAPLTGEEQALLDQFLGSDITSLRNVLGSIAQQDALGRAQTLLEPSLQRSIDIAQRNINEQLGATGNFFTTNRENVLGLAIGDIVAQQQAQLANLLPALTQLQLQAAGQLPQLLNIAGLPRQLEQARLEAAYQEFLRTTPAGGPLQALLTLASGAPAATPAFGPSKFSSLLSAAGGIGGLLTGIADLRSPAPAPPTGPR